MAVLNKMKTLIKLYDILFNIYLLFIVSLLFTDYSFFVEGGVSNLAVQIPIFAFLLVLRLVFDKGSFKNIFLIKLIARSITADIWVILSVLIGLFIVVFSVIGITRHLAFSSSGYDMAVTDQFLWNTVNGNFLFSSLDGNISHFGAHFEPIIFLLVPFYLVWPNAIILIIAQAFSLGVAIIPLYMIAKLRIKQNILIFAFILAYFLSRAVRGIGMLDFHTESFMVPLIFFSYYFLVIDRIRLALFSLLLLLLCKENASFLIIAFGMFSFFSLKKRGLGIILCTAGLSYWIVVTNWLMPQLAHTQGYAYKEWLPFGGTYADNFSAVIEDPSKLLNLAFGPGKTSFYMRLFAPLGFLALFSPAHYVLFIVPLSVQIIGSINHSGMQTISSHYPAHTLPFIFISAIYGAGWILDKFSRNNSVKYKKASECISLLIIILSLSFYGKSDGHKLSKFIQSAQELDSARVRAEIRKIPQLASVAALHCLVPHLSHRKFIYIWRNTKTGKFNTEYIVIHDKLLADGDIIGDIITALETNGYRRMNEYLNPPLYIYVRDNFDSALLEMQPKRLITLEP
jgi:uncharacterized membrane protein